MTLRQVLIRGHREGTVSLEREESLGAAILGLCELGSTEIRLAPYAHSSTEEQIYTLCHEGRHHEILVATTFGYVQTLLARAEVMTAEGRPVPHQLANSQQVLRRMLSVSFSAHEGYATLSEYLARESLLALFGSAADVPEPSPRYRRAMMPYRAVVEALPDFIRPLSHFVLRAFAESVFDTSIIDVARSSLIRLDEVQRHLDTEDSQPDYRLSRLSSVFVEILERWAELDAWAPLATIVERAGPDVARMIAELRFLSPPLEGVRIRRVILSHARRAVRETLRTKSAALLIENGRQLVHLFHNWCFDEFRQYNLLSGPMVDADAEPETAARFNVENQHVSGLVAETLPVAVGRDELLELADATLEDPGKRLAVGLRIVKSPAEHTGWTCQLRLVQFAAKTDNWHGPGTQPFQRILVERACVDHIMPTTEATAVLERLRDAIDILYFSTPEQDEFTAKLSDSIAGLTKATMVHLIDTLGPADTDKRKVDALLSLHSSGHPGFLVFADRDWVALFYQFLPSTFIGGIVLKQVLASTINEDLERWLDQFKLDKARPGYSELLKVHLGALSTFSKVYVYGGFREIVARET